MTENQTIKSAIFLQLQESVHQRVEAAIMAMEAAKESKKNETKSSAGDKFETGRAMIQMEEDRNKAQLQKALNLQKELMQINIKMTNDKVVLGSLVLTNQGSYFMAIGLGKIKVNQETYFVISLVSPIGALLKGKKRGEEVSFRGKKIRIKEII